MNRRNYALVELAVTLFVLLAAGVTGIHVLRCATAEGGTQLCRNNLKRIMNSAASYSADYKALPCAWDGKRTWVAVVIKDGKYFPSPKMNRVSELLCPSAPPQMWNGDSSKTYGMADRFKNSTKNGIVLSAVENPVDWPVYSDSVKGNKEEQVYIILKDFNGYVAVRHDKKANVAFADGHVAANNEQELMRFRDSRYYADRNFFSFYETAVFSPSSCFLRFRIGKSSAGKSR